MNIYADTSFFVSLYLPDRHSSEAQRRMAQRPRIWLTPLHRAEWTHAVAQHIFQGKISAREAQRVPNYKPSHSCLWPGRLNARQFVEELIPDIRR